VKQFFAAHKAPGAERAVQQSLERMEGCIQFQRMQQPSMNVWFGSL